MYSCARVLSRVWVRPCCRVQSLTIPELLQNKWTMCSLCIFKIYLFLFIFTSSSFVIYSAFCLLVFVSTFSIFGGGVEHCIFFFLILRSSFFLPCLLLSIFPPSFYLLTSCLFLSYYHSSLNSLLLFYGKNIISNFIKDSRL